MNDPIISGHDTGRQSDGTYRLRFDKALHGTIAGGGPEFKFTSFNGQVLPAQKEVGAAMNLLRDIKFALRAFSKARLFVAIAVLSIALGIGANTAIFSLTDQILMRNLPVANPEQLVMLTAVGKHYGSNSGLNRISYPMYQDFRDHNQVFSGMFCFRETDMSLRDGSRTERIAGELVSGNYFHVLGVKAALGRLFTAEDDLYQNAEPLVVLSYGYWQSRFSGSRSVIGRKLMINGFPMTVIGVSQADFPGLDPGYDRQVRVPMMMATKLNWFNDLNERRLRWVTSFGRLKPGVNAQSARASLQPYFHQILLSEVQMKDFAKAAPDAKREFLRMSMDVIPAATGRSQLRRQFSKPLLVLMATVALVLLIACANVANLLIARATGRQKEVRRSPGARLQSRADCLAVTCGKHDTCGHRQPGGPSSGGLDRPRADRVPATIVCASGDLSDSGTAAYSASTLGSPY